MIVQHFGFTAERIVLAVVNQGGGEAAIEFLNDLSEKNQVIRLVLLMIVMFLGDIVIVRVPSVVKSYSVDSQ